VPKNHGVHVLYLLKPSNQVHIWVHESIINRKHWNQMYSTWKRGNG